VRPARHGRPRRLPLPRREGAAEPRQRPNASSSDAEAEIGKLAAKFGEPVDGDDRDPPRSSLEQIRYQYRFVRWLRVRVEGASASAKDVGPDEERRSAATTAASTYEAKPNVWVLRCTAKSPANSTKLCLEAIKAGFEERRVRLAEQQAEIWVRMLDGLLTDLGHDPEDPKTAAIVERHLRAV
jgi:hypothetical protein